MDSLYTQTSIKRSDGPGIAFAECPYCSEYVEFINGEIAHNDCPHYYDHDGDQATFLSDRMVEFKNRLQNGGRPGGRSFGPCDHTIYSIGVDLKSAQTFRAIRINKPNKQHQEPCRTLADAVIWCVEDILKSNGWKE